MKLTTPDYELLDAALEQPKVELSQALRLAVAAAAAALLRRHERELEYAAWLGVHTAGG